MKEKNPELLKTEEGFAPVKEIEGSDLPGLPGRKPVSMKMLWHLFRVFFLIGGFTFGGGYAMLELIRVQIVEKEKWLDNESFIDLFAVAQSLPGVFAVNISIFIGYRLQGFWGAVVCVVGTTLPSFLIILILAIYAQQFKENPIVSAVFKGVRPAVVALIIAPCVSVWKALKLGWKYLWIPVLCAVSVTFLGVSPVTVILVSAAVGWLYTKFILNRLPASK